MLGKVFIMETVTCNLQLLKIKALLLTFLRDFIKLIYCCELKKMIIKILDNVKLFLINQLFLSEGSCQI